MLPFTMNTRSFVASFLFLTLLVASVGAVLFQYDTLRDLSMLMLRKVNDWFPGRRVEEEPVDVEIGQGSGEQAARNRRILEPAISATSGSDRGFHLNRRFGRQNQIELGQIVGL